ncbi:DUF839 domain-containing protein [soil metagenome]
MTAIDRRSFLTRGAALACASAVSTLALGRLYAQSAWAAGRSGLARGKGGYGPLARRTALNEPGGPEYLALPEGFSYVVFGKTGDPMTDGTLTPQAHDGMAAFARPGGRVRLIRNHEVRNAPGDFTLAVVVPPEPNSAKYDPLAVGGTVSLDFDVASMSLERDFVSQAGSIVNCAGGIMLGQSGWITSEETTAGPNEGWAERHGYNFPVPVNADGPVFSRPLTAMGRFAHEAVAADPRTGLVYETEDSGDDSGFYRFTPNDPHNLSAGGRLEMLGIEGYNGYNTLTGQVVGRPLPVKWVPIRNADPDLEAGARPVAIQGIAAGAAFFNRLEGIWWGGDRCLFNSTSGGNAHLGQVWEYRPSSGGGILTLVYESTGIDPNVGRPPLDSPDNLTITPRGGVLLCEDDSNANPEATGDTHPLAPGIIDVNRLIGLADDGQPFEFAVNTFSNSEFAGACFAPNARDVLFVNIQGFNVPGTGMTFAVTGPWRQGAL